MQYIADIQDELQKIDCNLQILYQDMDSNRLFRNRILIPLSVLFWISFMTLLTLY